MRSTIARAGTHNLRFVEAIALVVVAITVALSASLGGATAKADDPASEGRSRLKSADFRLVGGWRLAQQYPRGGLAIDFANQRIFMGGHAQRHEIVEFALTRHDDETGQSASIPPGTGEDVMKWPPLKPVKVHAGFWEGGYVGGLYYNSGVLWASPKKFYDMSPPASFRLYGKNLNSGEVETVFVRLPRQAFGGGFIKGKPGTMLVGCGGYESGQGSVAGPTLGTVDGKVLIGQANHGTMEFEKRELRPATYWPVKQVDGWIALKPRDGVGRWACDRVHAGGIWNPRGVAYWALLGVGDIDYARQNETFAARNETWLYTYDSKTYTNVAFTKWDHGHVHGHEVAEDGRVYLLIRNAWGSGRARVDSVIKVFEIID